MKGRGVVLSSGTRAQRLDRAVGRADPGRGHTLSARAGIADNPATRSPPIFCEGQERARAEIVIYRAWRCSARRMARRHYGLHFSVVDDFDYPGHSARRMHGSPSRSGAELVDRLRDAWRPRHPLLTDATSATLFAEAKIRVRGVGCHGRTVRANHRLRPLCLLVAAMAEIQSSCASTFPRCPRRIYFGHPGNRGDAILWGERLGAKLAFMSGYQGHGSVAHPHGILITWAVITEGGFQVDAQGRRFANEATGYSEQAEAVLVKAQGTGFDIFDERIAGVARQFEDFRKAEAAGAVISAATYVELATRLNLPASELAKTFDQVSAMKRGLTRDPLGRSFSGSPDLTAPFKAVKVTDALFHTQGGLVVNREARVLKTDGSPFPNLLAAGGAAAGVSGSTAAGYLSGNGLLTATVLGRKAGQQAAILHAP